MNYELAKELKDAGFIQPPVRNPFAGLAGWWNQDVYTPSLSELMEACGEGFNALWSHPENNPRTWEAGIMVDGWEGASFHRTYPTGVGSTPEEAVARLWLSLNKKPPST